MRVTITLFIFYFRITITLYFRCKDSVLFPKFQIFSLLFYYLVTFATLFLSLRLPSVRIEAAAGFPVGCGRFIGSGLTVVPSGRDKASRASLSWPLLSPMERGASTLEERGRCRLLYTKCIIIVQKC